MTISVAIHRPGPAWPNQVPDSESFMLQTDTDAGYVSLFFPNRQAAARWLRDAHRSIFPGPDNVQHARSANTQPSAHDTGAVIPEGDFLP